MRNARARGGRAESIAGAALGWSPWWSVVEEGRGLRRLLMCACSARSLERPPMDAAIRLADGV